MAQRADSTTDGDLFDALGFRGLRLATSKDMYPDALRGYAPVIRGIADSSSQARVRKNGNVIYQTSVPAGAFVISDLSPGSPGGALRCPTPPCRCCSARGTGGTR